VNHKKLKRILFVTDTYYPDSSATTTLARRTAEALVQLGYSVDAYPSEISGNHFSYPDSYNGVKICRTEGGSGENNAPVKATEDHIATQTQVNRLACLLDVENYDCVFSVAVAFEVNFLVHDAIARSSNSKWFPMAYDPYAYDPHVTKKQRQERAVREIDALKDATKVFFLTEFKEDYIGSPIEEKIEWFMLPCIRPIVHSTSSVKTITFDETYINCVFLGDFYYGVENTDFIFRLFEPLDKNIRLYTVGNLCDFGPTVEFWKNKLGDRYICHERVSQEEAHNIMLDCDVLVSMGHDSANMCPSKIIDFISSGKPILHIKKIEDCCGEKYLQKYPNKYCIYQNDTLTQTRVNEVGWFIMKAKGAKSISFNELKVLYGDFTMETLIEKIEKEINKYS